MKGSSQTALAAVFVVALGACASAPVYPGYEIYPDTMPPPMATQEKDAAAKAFQVVEGRSNVYIYRTGTEPLKLLVHVDDRMAEELTPSSFMVVGVTPKEHSVTACDGRIVPPQGGTYYVKKDFFGKPVPFTPEPSRNVYIKVSAKSAAALSPIADVEVVTDEKRAQEEIRRCRLIEKRWPIEKHFPDVFQ